jgi:hypothetical protein
MRKVKAAVKCRKPDWRVNHLRQLWLLETKAAVKRRTPNWRLNHLECGALPPLLFL